MDRGEELRKLYDVGLSRLAIATPNETAQLIRELRILSSELEALEDSDESTMFDELADRRARGGKKPVKKAAKKATKKAAKKRGKSTSKHSPSSPPPARRSQSRRGA
ncbi:MAG: hypothetical protein AAGA37_19835 [Actinomycetota bacterium]